MVHCNPAPPHPPPGEVYSVICVGKPYIDGFPVGYLVVGLLLIVFVIVAVWVFLLPTIAGT